MPKISSFFGLAIYMYAKDHAPPHFHVKFENEWAVIDIQSGDIIDGKLPTKQLRLVQAWVEIHREELMENWQKLQEKSATWFEIEPLK